MSTFGECKSLTDITLPEGLTYIGMDAFRNCSSLKSITIPSSVTNISSDAFKNCTNLQTVVIQSSSTIVSDTAFDGCYALNIVYDYVDSTTIISGDCGENVTYSFNLSTGALTLSGTGDTYEYNFDNNSLSSWNEYLEEIKTVVIEDGVTNIGSELFRKCTALTSISIPSSVTYISGMVFYNCTSLESITIPDSVTSIYWYAFYNCTSLKSITIPNSVTYIDWYTFSGCTSLTSITIPDSVTCIGWDAFKNCASLTDVYFEGTEEEWNSIAIYGGNDYLKNATIHYSGVASRPATTLLLLKKSILGISSSNSKSLDYNYDGKINVIDLAIAKQELLNE